MVISMKQCMSVGKKGKEKKKLQDVELKKNNNPAQILARFMA